ncbi:MAG TPA: hypothetical protein PK777_15340, partial [Thermoguttaceae bacterium]|nr:hypothetical protein [Thermoguttaceae bacterium]
PEISGGQQTNQPKTFLPERLLHGRAPLENDVADESAHVQECVVFGSTFAPGRKNPTAASELGGKHPRPIYGGNILFIPNSACQGKQKGNILAE